MSRISKTVSMGGVVFATAASFLSVSVGSSAPQTQIQPTESGFIATVQPFLTQNCIACHSAALATAGVDIEALNNPTSIAKHRDDWDSIVSKIVTGEMPPPGVPRPDADEAKVVTEWLAAEFKRQDKLIPPDPGKITARRLNRAEYNNTVRDLLGVDFHPADDFPQDDSGYGFDNNGDVLSLSPSLMEKYLTAAERITRAALYGNDVVEPTMAHYQPNLRRPMPPANYEGYDETGRSLPSSFNGLHQFPADAEYLFKITLNGARPGGSKPVTLAVWVDGKQIQQFTIDRPDMEGGSRQFRARVPQGEHLVSASFLKQFEGLPPVFRAPNPAEDPKAETNEDGTPKPLGEIPQTSVAGRVEAVDIGGPFDAKPNPPTESLGKIFVCGHLDGNHNEACPRQILSDIARRAYRRPVAPREVDALVALFGQVRANGDSFNEAIAIPIQYVLSSPDFLFRIEKSSSEDSASGIRPIGQFDLATRLSYFVWSSMPDEELYRVAEEGRLREPAVLEAQVRRMLGDSKSKALIDNFAGQWLLLRNIDVVNPEWTRFLFDDLLRMSMKRETELFLMDIVQEDRSVIDIIDAKYTFLNDRLARFYGVPGVTGPEFRKVDLAGNSQRGGLLTHASVLTVSSYATRTSPVLRGKWILDNILNTPPPPPPPNVPDLDVAEVGASVSLRQQLEVHRANPLCASCHGRMDPLGFSLENYNAIGEWRDRDGEFPIDSSGELPDGTTFEGPEGLKAVILSKPDAFARAITDKLLTYALGRGLERFDKPVIDGIVNQAGTEEYRFSSIVLGIVQSMPFQMERAGQPAKINGSTLAKGD
jgi:mono/diheme cytochrome c family protein